MCALYLPTMTGVEIFKALDDHVSGKLCQTHCVFVYIDGVKAKTGCLSGFITQVKQVVPNDQATKCLFSS